MRQGQHGKKKKRQREDKTNLLKLLSGNKLVDESLDTLDNDDSSLLHLLLLLLGKDSVGLVELLEILSGLVSPEKVVKRGLVKVLIDVVESVLGDVSDNDVGVLPNLSSLVGLKISDEELDKGGLSGTVRSKNGDSGRKGDLKGDIEELLDRLGGVLESNLSHLDKGLLLGLDSIKKRRVGELELVLIGSGEGVVRLGLGDHSDEVLKVSGLTVE